MLIASEVIAVLHELVDLITGGSGLRADLHAKINGLDGTTPPSPAPEPEPAPAPAPEPAPAPDVPADYPQAGTF